MQRDVLETEIVVEKCIGERGKRNGDENELARRCRPRHDHPRGPVRLRADQAEAGLKQAQANRDRERELSELGDHSTLPSFALARASATSGGI